MIKLRNLLTAGAVCLSLGIGSCALADFSDLEGHWAYATITNAVADGYMSGFEDGTVRPDAAITKAQAVTLITKLMNIGETAELDISEELWYYDAASHAVAFGIAEADDDFGAELSRIDAFSMLASTFALVHGDEDLDELDSYTDVSALTAGEKQILCAMIESGYITGYNGTIRPYDSLSRAEFMTVLYRILNSGELVSDSDITDITADTIWLDCQTTDIELTNITADTLVLRSENLGELDMKNCDINTLIIACGGEVTVDSYAKNLIIAEANDKITVTSELTLLRVCDDNLRVIAKADIEKLELVGDDNYISTISSADVENASVFGAENYLYLAGDNADIKVYGSGNKIEGSGSFDLVTLYAPDCEITKKAKTLNENIDYGLTSASLAMSAPSVLAVESELSVSATVADISGTAEDCTALWFIDGELIKTETYDISDGDVLSLAHSIEYSRDMDTNCDVRLLLRYDTAYGQSTELSASAKITLENYDDTYYNQYDTERVLERVTPYYLGDYTLEWAEANDYEDYEKELWINAMGYTSQTEYLIWINQAYQRVNIFDTTGDSLVLIYSCIVGCGRDDLTPIGVYTTTMKQEGWFASSYTCKPIVRFFEGTGYAFHSRLYIPNTDTLSDPGIGYPISAGCIRMYDEDIAFIYDNIPNGTTVVVY